MISQNQIETNAKKKLAIKDFDLLTIPGILGAYKECELTHIYLMETNTKKFFHYYAILSYEEYLEQNNELKEKFLTPKPINISKQYKLGIIQSRISFDYAKNIFEQLCIGNLTINNTIFCISTFITILPKTHIPSSWKVGSALLQKVLKPNFGGDNYIIEFFSNQNHFKEMLSAKEFEKVNTEIKNHINIDLNSINDRIGSFIFQFPITLVKTKIKPTNDRCNVELSVKTYPPFDQNENIICFINTELDDAMTGCNTFEGVCEKQLIELGDSHNLEFLMINKQNKLVYQHSMVNFVRNINIGGSIGIHNSEPRTIKNSENKEIHIDLLSSYSFSAGKSSDENYDTRIKKRMEHNDIIKVSNKLKVFKNQREEALRYIRNLILQNGNNSSEIWILDPYLLGKDILDTLYHFPILGVKLKCITSYKKSQKLRRKTENDVGIFSRFKKCIFNLFRNNIRRSKNYYFKQYKQEQIKYFLSHSNNLGINLEYRVIHNTAGFDFHDRFLYFIPINNETLPTVYSLGTSVNSLGRGHHIIQQVPDPRELVRIFDELWNKLDNDANRIIKLPEENNNEK